MLPRKFVSQTTLVKALANQWRLLNGPIRTEEIAGELFCQGRASPVCAEIFAKSRAYAPRGRA